MPGDTAIRSKKLCTNIIISVIEETLNHLCIVREIGTNTETPSNLEQNKLIQESFSDNRNNKFKTDLELIEKVLSDSLNELKDKQTYNNLTEFITKYNKLKEEETDVLKQHQVLQEELGNMRYLLEKEKLCFYEEIFECLGDTGRIKDEMEDAEMEMETKMNYVKKWLNSKSEISEMKNSHLEESLSNTIRNTEKDIEREDRTHLEIQSAINEFIKDDIALISYWKQKYENDIVTKTKEIQMMQKQCEELSKKKSNAADIFLKQKKEIADYKAHKAEILEQKRRLEERIQAAIRIQAWWRGTMVRKGFGRFRKKKEKKQKKNKGSSEKKNRK